MATVAQRSLGRQKVAAYLRLMQENDSLWNGLLVFLGALFLLGTIPFYPLYLVPILALACGIVGYRIPWAGMILGMILAVPAVAYQSPLLGWIYLIILAMALFEMFDKWAMIAVLEILILAPFSFGNQPFFGWITILGMLMASLHFGSRKSMLIAIPSVLMILLLSSVWMVDNNAFMPVRLEVYKPGMIELQMVRPALAIGQIPREIGSAIVSLFAPHTSTNIFGVSGLFIGNIMKILFSDSGLLQLMTWAIVLFSASYLSGAFKKRSQLIASLTLLLVPASYYGITLLFGTAFNPTLLAAVGATIAVMGILDFAGVSISREVEVERGERQKAFSKFGLQDMGSGKGEKSLADIGDYEDVKEELRDAIITPLENKELAYTYGIKPPSGILLFGPPGTGKTMLMRALAKELRYGFYYIKSSDILSQWYGESEKNTSEIFSIARKNAPSILFFDEIDSIGKKRTAYSADDVGPRILSVLLQEMDGAKTTTKPVLVVGATNIPHQLDPALLRPGRMDKIIYMHLPPPEARQLIFRVHLRAMEAKGAVAPDVDVDVLSRKTGRFSGADIRNIVQEAIQLAAKEASRTGKVVPVTMAHLTRVLGTIKPSTSLAALEDYERFRMDFERRVGSVEEAKPIEEVVHWEEVAGLEDIKQSLLETIELPLLHESEMKEFKVKPSKGILLFGPPGTGKTLIIKAASSELKASFQILSAAELLKEGYTRAVGVIKETFNRARENTPAIIFIDEIETLAPARGSIGGSTEILGQFLTELDGMKELKGVVLIGTTNKPSIMDPALLRPGRFDKIFYIPPPDEEGRADIFRIHLGKFAQGVDLEELARQSPGFTGADIAGVCQQAKMEALRGKLQGKEPKITTETLVRIIRQRRPSVTPEMLEEFERFREAYGERR